MPRFRSALYHVAALAAVSLSAPAFAQVPNLGFVFPPGGQAGTKAPATVNGANLQDATAVLLSGEGVQADITNKTNAAALALDLTIAPTATPGPREVRVVTPRGTSNAGRIWVGSYPEVNEIEPNTSLPTGQKLDKLPVTVNGQINGAEDMDFFTFQANAGDTYVFDLVALRMVSGLDGYLTLYDSKGKILQTRLEGFDRDPRIIYTFKNAGAYTIEVRDSMYRGGGNFVYKLTMGKVPAVTGYLPVGGKRGETVNVALEGVNLGDMKTMAVQIPAGQDLVTVMPNTPMGPAITPVSLTAGDLPEITETEPNDTPAQATVVPTVPGVINGRINKPGDVDLYRIRPAAAGNLTFEVFGRRIGSRIDSNLRLLDATGKLIQENDDADGKDSRIVLGVTANTEYLVEVRTMDQHFGGDVYYRLEIDPPSGPDFRLTMTPDSVNIGQGGSAAVTATVARLNGFGAAVNLRVEGLPAGVTASPASIPAGAASAQFTLTAEPGAAPGALGRIRVVGTGEIAGKPAERVAQGTEVYLPVLGQAGQERQRPTMIQTATVMPQQAYFLTLDQRAVTVKRGGMVPIKVTATRQMGQTAAITITAAGQPANVTPALQNIAAMANDATITVTVAANAPVGTYNVIFSGNLANNVQVAPALTLTITE
jgi:hypothetical protein